MTVSRLLLTIAAVLTLTGAAAGPTFGAGRAAGADLSLSVQSPDSALGGQHLTLRIMWRNAGPESARNAKVRIATTGVLLGDVKVESSTGTCTTGGCRLGDLAVGAQGTAVLTGVPLTLGTLHWRVGLSSDTPDPAAVGNGLSHAITVHGLQADLALRVIVPETVTAGRYFYAGFWVSNNGPNVARHVVLHFAHAGPKFEHVQFWVGNDSISCHSACVLGDVPPGTTVAVALGAAARARGTFAWSVTVTSSSEDLVPGNNRTSGRLRVD